MPLHWATRSTSCRGPPAARSSIWETQASRYGPTELEQPLFHIGIGGYVDQAAFDPLRKIT
ncbi:MAG: hypothetical protein ACR2HY_10610 [Acidimicrobiales bacterium]